MLEPDLCCHQDHIPSFLTDLMMQVFAAVSVSTGCLSFGICMAYTSSAIPSMMESSSAINITDSEASWMSESLGLCAFVSITDVACKRILLGRP